MLLEVDNLGFSYGGHRVLHDVSFQMEPGETVALLGPNGVGKSTLFRCILDFLKSYEGAIRLKGEDIRSLGAKEKAQTIAYIPQVSAPVFDFTVIELCLMGFAAQLPYLSSPGSKEETLALGVLEEVGIGHLAYSPVGQISGGEYQLALMARALLQQAPILVMDEPTANLDYGNQFRIMERISRLADAGYSILFSAHDPNQVLMHASRVLALKEGSLRADGDPRVVMNEGLLSELYGIDVRRVDVAYGGMANEKGSVPPSEWVGGPMRRVDVTAGSARKKTVSLCYPHSNENQVRGQRGSHT